jgi:hypothetical protein
MKNWWKKLFRITSTKTLAPLAVDLETGKIYVWSGYRMIDTGIVLGSLRAP